MGGAEARQSNDVPRPLAEQRRSAAFEQAHDRAEQPSAPGSQLSAVPGTEQDAGPVLNGEWVQRIRRRYVARVILVLAVIGVLVGLGLTFAVRTPDALAVLVAFTIVAVIAYTSVSVNAPTTVTLAGPVLTVRRGTQTDQFDLTGPIRRVVTTGRPNRPNWRIRFETTDGRHVELGPTQVDPHVITEVLARYRTNVVPRQRRTED